MSQSIVGASTPQVTAREKVMGRAQYAGDIKLPGMLHAKVLRSPHPHARIVGIDISAAKALPGVKLVVTGRDTPTRCGGRTARSSASWPSAWSATSARKWLPWSR